MELCTAVHSQLFEWRLQLNPSLNYHQASSLTCWSIQTPSRGCLIGDLMITGNKSCRLPTPRKCRVLASVYPELLRFIFQLLRENAWMIRAWWKTLNLQGFIFSQLSRIHYAKDQIFFFNITFEEFSDSSGISRYFLLEFPFHSFGIFSWDAAAGDNIQCTHIHTHTGRHCMFWLDNNLKF